MLQPPQSPKSPQKKLLNPKSNVTSGKAGEDYACTLLKNENYRIIARNFRSKLGEIDIIAQDNDTLVFVEVKTRWTSKYGEPEEAVTSQKLNHIARAGQYFALKHPELPRKQRIDVVAINVRGGRVVSAKIINV